MSLQLTECLSLSEASAKAGQPRVDRAKGVIRRVKVLGWESANGRKYLPTSVKASLYEGKRVNAGHVKLPGGERDPRDTYAVLEGVTVEADGVYADRLRLLNPEGEFEKRLLGSAENAPHLFGLSHVAHGRDKSGSHGKVIESVERVDSVDLVNDPATVRGLHESRVRTMTVREVIESLKATRPEYVRALREVAEAGIVSPDAAMDAPAEGGDKPADHEAALLDAAAAVLRDDGLSSADKLGKIRKILAIVDGKGAGGGGGDKPDAAEESRKQADANLREEVARLKAEKEVRAAAGRASFPLTESLVEMLARPGMTAEQADKAVAEVRASGARREPQRPVSAAPANPPAKGNGAAGKVQESRQTDVPQGVKDRAEWIKRG